jgi:DNA-binding NarL/FixJ family response regulator
MSPLVMKTPTSSSTIRVAVIARAPEVCRNCLDVFGKVHDCDLVAVVTNESDAIRGLPALAPDVVVVDGSCEFPIPEAVAGKPAAMPLFGAPAICLGDTGTRRWATIMVERPEDLPAAVRLAARRSGSHKHGHGNASGVGVDQRFARLSPRERDVVTLIAQSYSYKDIAKRLGIGVSTIGTHMNHIYEKLGLCTRREIVARYGFLANPHSRTVGI